jgi:ParB family chromosome partitioning protein
MKTDATTKQTLMHVPLARLKFGHERPGQGINARAPNGGHGIAELANSIRRLGIVIPLVVQESPSGHDTDVYVADGNRRLEALRLIDRDSAKDGADYDGPLNLDAIPCVAGIGDGLELSLVANVDRLPLHPVDKCEAFAILVDGGASLADVAARFSIRPREVEQALAIRALAPEVRAAWRTGDIKAEDAQAFTIEPDQKRQAKVFTKLHARGDLWGANIRRELVGNRGDASKSLAFVGVEAYEAAGGKIARDLFREQHAVSDLALLKRLTDERIKNICVGLMTEGWAWALPAEEVKNRYSLSRLHADEKPTKEERARLKALDAICDREEGEDDDSVQAAFAERDRIGQAITLRAFTPEQRKRSGVIVSLDHDGDLEIAAGYVMSKAAAETAAAKASGEAPSPADKKKAEAARARKATAGEVSKSLDQDLLDLLRDATARALKLEAALFGEKVKLAALLAGAVARLVDVDSVGRYNRPIDDKAESAIRAAIAPAIMVDALRSEFDAKDYFKRVPKANMLAILREAIPPEVDRAAKLKTEALIKFCVANVPETGWLPVQLRGPWYDAKAKPTAKARRR